MRSSKDFSNSLIVNAFIQAIHIGPLLKNLAENLYRLTYMEITRMKATTIIMEDMVNYHISR